MEAKMITLGIDLSSKRDDTAACLIEWEPDRASHVAEPEKRCDDPRLCQLIAEASEGSKASAIGIDAPFGWPDGFSAAVAEWTSKVWTENEAFRKSLRFRTTDLFVQRMTKLWPLSVSTSLIALPAMRAMAC
jgi:hypothetical protein